MIEETGRNYVPFTPVGGSNVNLGTNRGRCFRYIAISIGWAADEVWPVVSSTIHKVYCSAFHAFIVISQELSSYVFSSSNEARKFVHFFGHCVKEIYHFPQGTIRTIFFELGNYWQSGCLEIIKSSITVLKKSDETSQILFYKFIQPLTLESVSYLFSGRVQIKLYAESFKKEFSHWHKCAAYVIYPIVNESISYIASGVNEMSKALASGKNSIVESSQTIKLISEAIVQEIYSYLYSLIYVIADALHTIALSADELISFIKSTPLQIPLVELASYLSSSKEELKKYSHVASASIDETDETMRILSTAAIKEIYEYFASTFHESLKAAIFVQHSTHEFLGFFSVYIHSILTEMGSSTISGIHENCKAAKNICSAIDETISPLRNTIGNVFLEIASYSSSSTGEIDKCLFKTIPESFMEGSRNFRESISKILHEFRSYCSTGIHATTQATIATNQSMHEAMQMPKEFSLNIIQELKSYLHSVNGEILKLDDLLKNDLPISLKHGIEDPLIELTQEFVIEYRRWRQSRNTT